MGVALAFGLLVCVTIYATGHISGVHFDPAASMAFAAAGRFPWREVPARPMHGALRRRPAERRRRLLLTRPRRPRTLPPCLHIPRICCASA